ncbi:MAG TPA: FAD-dependent thymidylate synthase [Nitrospiria bacterium]|nr:FAD-dependent thymidylate synthase [Nitrospiria bacterium]
MSDKSFTNQEREHLAPFFTNTDRDTFGLKLPQEVAGALFSRYSRSAKDLRRVFLDEFFGEMDALRTPTASDDINALKKARTFYDRVLVGYGDDSVAQLGGAHIACEGISNVAANLIEDARIGLAPLEKSTRYVRFDRKNSEDEYLFYKEPGIMASKHASKYLEVMNRLFQTYARQMDPMINFVTRRLPITEMPFKHPQTGEALTYTDVERDAELKKWAETAYRGTIRAHACDLLRGYLPASTKTNVGLFGTGQAFEYLLTKLYSHPLTEMRQLAEQMHGELSVLIPSFVKRARSNSYLTETYQNTRVLAQQQTTGLNIAPSETVTLVDYDPDAEERVLSAILYPHTRHSLTQLRAEIKSWDPEHRARLLNQYLDRRKHRRDKPGRAFEQVYYTFDLLGNLGMYRDLHRHRILSQERQDFSTAHGYDTPNELAEIGFKRDFDQCMIQAADLYDQIYADLPHEAQYVVPFAYRVRWYMKMNLRELVHIAELRTMPQGHPDYRSMVQEICRKVEAVHPILFQYSKFIDWKEYHLGRLHSEMRTEYKKSILAQNPESRP